MNLKSSNLKLIVGVTYLSIILIGLYFLFSYIDFRDLMSYEFIRSNKDVILKYKSENFIFLTSAFFFFTIIWILCLGFVLPLLFLSGFIFGKWWGILIILSSTTIGATLFYMLANFFFQDFIKAKLAPKFSKLKNLFIKNDVLYFTIFRIAGGGGAPYTIQNLLPVLFNMPIKNYFIATLAGSAPSMFVTVALGSGIEKIIDRNDKLSISTVLSSPDIYIPIIAFFILLIVTLVLKKIYFKK
jgi:uncharacterized membrane protein YdjX (TVP38/TMEM64 family)